MTDPSEHSADGLPARHVDAPPSSEALQRPPRATSASSVKAGLAKQWTMISVTTVAGAVGSQLIMYAQDLLAKPVMDGMPPFPPELVAAADRAALGNATIGFALAGAVVAAVLGASLWVLRGAAQHAIRGVLTGLVAGAILGALGGALNTLLYRQLVNMEFDELFRAMLVHAPFWICLSIALGLTLGMSLREIRTGKVIGAALGAAILASLLYPLLAMLLFPAVRAERVILVDLGPRLLWVVLGVGMVTWAAVRAATNAAADPPRETTGD